MDAPKLRDAAVTLPEKVTVAIVDDDPIIMLSLERAVREHPHLTLLWSVGSLGAAFELARGQQAQVYLVDLDLPDGRGEQFIKWVSAEQITSDCLVLSNMGDYESVIDSFIVGAKGYLLKDTPHALLGKHILQLRQNGSPVSPQAARMLLKAFQSRVQDDKETAGEHPVLRKFMTQEKTSLEEDGEPLAPTNAEEDANRLSQREMEVLQYLHKGMSYQDIAIAMNLSYHTITTYLRRIYRKLGVRSRSAAVYQALNRKILLP